MEVLNEKELKMITDYKRNNGEDILLYFFNKFKEDVINITYSKIVNKFNNLPIEKGDLIYIVWKALKKTLGEFSGNKDNFGAFLINNCYFICLNDVRRFISNGELVLNKAYSIDKMIENHSSLAIYKSSEKFSYSRDLILKNLIDDVVAHLKRYKKKEIMNVIYLKSEGYSLEKISKILHLPKCRIKNLLNSCERIVEKIY